MDAIIVGLLCFALGILAAFVSGAIPGTVCPLCGRPFERHNANKFPMFTDISEKEWNAKLREIWRENAEQQMRKEGE